ncbi:hypothetical protein FHW23_000105 [Curtobacterium pusillum]|uniref:D-apionate lactonase C-terminal domain-containing protein n=1 Tax=Curtobacterium pusillum TaxID=69373 RepID=A0AAW3T0G0_9MICO|nr:hypothetical protein [Curtobacterium pusillum]MBA8988873.1 hypothetical protein [Curtobacterium pusillum]
MSINTAPSTTDLTARRRAGIAAVVPDLRIDWSRRTGISGTTPTLQVVVNSKLMPEQPVREGAYRAFRDLDCEYVRYVPWFPYPHMSVPELDPPTATTTSWDFTFADPPAIDFLDATAGRHPVLNFSTIPAWMFVGGEDVAYPEDPDGIFWRYNEGTELRDPSGRELGDYFARLVSWYTQGGFTDELGVRHESGHHYELPIWEVLNEADLEHATTPKAYTERYDVIVEAIRSVSPETEFVGLGIANPSANPEYFEYFLNPANHRDGIPLDWISYHFYAAPAVAEGIDEWQHTMFAQADGFLATVRYVESIRKRLSPSTRTMINETGAILGDDHLTAWGADMGPDPQIPDAYWNLAGAVYAHLVVELTRMGIDAVGASQLVGYPGQFPSVTMVDWETGAPNARFQVLRLLRDHIGPGDELVEDPLVATVGSGAGAMRRVTQLPTQLAFVRDGVRKVLLVNRTGSDTTVPVHGAAGGTLAVVDVASAGGPVREARVDSDIVPLGAYAVAVVTLPHGTGA